MKSHHILISGFAAVSVLVAIMGIILFFELEKIDDRINEIAEIETPSLIALSSMKANVLEGIEEAFAYVLLNDIDEKEKFFEKMNEFDEQSIKFKKLESDFVDKSYDIDKNDYEEKVLFEKIINTKSKLVETANIFFEDYENNGKINPQLMHPFEESVNEIISLIDEFIIIELDAVYDAHNSAQNNIILTNYTTIGLTILIILIIIVLGIMFNRLLRESINKRILMEKEINKKEIQLKKDRLTMIGEMSSKLTHDIRNPLTVIKTTADMLRLKFESHDEKTKEFFDRLDGAIEQVRFQIEDVMNFVRTTPLETRNHSLSKIIDSAISQVEIPSEITITKPDADITISCDDDKMRVVFINLITNAVQSLGKKGQISLKVKEKKSEIIIEVEDNGHGITKDDLTSIFEPLFTTKSKGTGLGLASCKTIIEQHGGHINAHNNPTRFIIKLPIHS